jgi:TOMM system kinase/cyclase fusion protein
MSDKSKDVGGTGAGSKETRSVPAAAVTDDVSTPALGPFDRLVGEVFGGQYRIEAHLGAGGFGEVFRAIQEKTGQQVALKILRPRQGGAAPSVERQLARFRREMRICAELHHPHIVRLIDSGETETGLVFSVFEYVPGQTLAELLREKGSLTVQMSIDLMSQALDALGTAHGRGIIHRDLKPSNIMVSSTGLRPQITVLDFGISAFLEGMNVDDFTNLTMTRETLGTPAYAAPEQLRGETPSVKTDLYAWGLVFAECILGRPVFGGATAMEIAHRQLSPEPIVLPERLQRSRLGSLLRWVLEKDVTRRAGDAASVMERLLERRSVVDLVDANGYFVENEPEQRFSARPTPGAGAAEVSPADLGGGERRQVTALCCVLGVAPAGPASAPEEIDLALQESQSLCMRVASRFGGQVAGTLGGQLLMYFGLASASDADVRRSAIAALEIAHDLRRRNQRSTVRADFKIGIHTGMVTTIGFDQSPGTAIFGITPARAAELAQGAPANTIVASADSAHHLGASFELRATPSARGESSYQLVGEKGPASTGASSARVPFVGRVAELQALTEAWQQARQGRGGTVVILGQPGLGKSRLARELRRVLDQTSAYWVEARCLPELQHSGLAPVIRLLKDELDVSAGPDGSVGLETALGQLGLDPASAMPLLCPWLGLPPGPHQPLPVSPPKQKAMLLELLVELTVTLAERSSAPVLFEDLHWADPTTREYLDLLVRRFSGSRCLLIVTSRPITKKEASGDEEVPWPGELARTIHLPGLQPVEVERIIRELVGRECLSPTLVDNVVERAEGNPFFVEEVTRFINESADQVTLGAGSTLPAGGIPIRLRDILTGRLDRLGRAKETAQVAAAIGREFDYRLLAAVLGDDEASLLTDLEKMVSADLVTRRRHVDNPLYMFRHALIRDASYESLPLPARQRTHGRIATAIDDRFPEIATSRPEIVAHHYTNAGLPAQATGYWEKAGQQAIARFAHLEAGAHLGNAIAQQLALPASRERSRKEMDLRTQLGLAFMTIKGYSANEVEETYRRAAELCDELGDELPLRVLYGIWVVNIVRADPQPVARLVERFKQLARTSSDNHTLLISHAAVQAGVVWYPDHAEALRHGDEARRRFDFSDPKRQHETLLREYQFEGLFYPFGYGAWGRVITGSLSEGRALWEQGFEIAKGVGDPYVLATLRSFGILINYVLGDFAAARTLADDLRAVTVERSFLLWKAFAIAPRGRLMVASGQVEEGLSELNEGLGILRAVGAMISFAIYLGMQVEALMEIRRFKEAETTCDEGLTMVRASGFRAYEPVLLRLKAELLENSGDLASAEATLNQSLELSRRQGALLFELGAAVALARFHQRRGQPARGRPLLADLLSRIEPTSREPILENARRLLEQL